MSNAADTRTHATKEAVFSFISAFWREHNYAPSIREIAEAVGVASPSTVHFHLNQLKRDGLITFDAGKSRSIRLTHKDSENKSWFQKLSEDGAFSSPEMLAYFLSDIQLFEPRRTPAEWARTLREEYNSLAIAGKVLP